MRPWLVLVSLIAAAGAGVLAVPGASADGAVCGPAKSTTLAANRLARVYSKGQKVYGCIRGGHSSYELGSTSNSPGEARVGPIALAGVDAAFGRTSSGVDVISAEVVVERLTDGVVLRDRSATTANVGPEYAQQVDSVVVKPDGSVAWIGSVSSITSHRDVIQVRKSDRTARAALDSGPKIGRRSLRLHGSELSWRDGSATKTAKLR